MRLGVAAAALAGTLLSGCAATTNPTPGSPTASPVLVTPSPVATDAPTPKPTILAFPTVSEVDLAPGRYDSSPPFDLAFSFEIPEDGWHSAHIHGEFFDVMRFDGADPRAPTSWVAWALPQTIIGTTSQAAVDLTPEEAAELMSTKEGVTASETAPFTFLGEDGVQLDLSASAPVTHIFGGPEGNFGLDPIYPMRIGIVDNDPGLLLVLCLVPEDGEPTGCGDSQSIIDTAEP
jgi:hypothetical protein